MRRIVSFILILGVLILGLLVIIVLNTKIKLAMPDDGYFRVIPDELFKGNAKELEPHLNWKSGKFLLKYNGNEYKINIITETWVDGKVFDRSSTGITGEEPLDSPFTFSIKDNNDKGELIYVLNGNIAYLNPDIDFELSPDYKLGSEERLEEITNVPLGDEIPIWGYFKYKEPSQRTRDGIEEYAKYADWSYLIKLQIDVADID